MATAPERVLVHNEDVDVGVLGNVDMKVCRSIRVLLKRIRLGAHRITLAILKIGPWRKQIQLKTLCKNLLLPSTREKIQEDSVRP